MKILMERHKRQFEEYQDQSAVLNKSQRLELSSLDQTTLLQRLGGLSSLRSQDKNQTQQLSHFTIQPQKSPTLQKSLVSLSTRNILLNIQDELNSKQQTLTIPELKNIQNKNSKSRENFYQMLTSIAKRQQIREHFKLKHSSQSNENIGNISQNSNLKQSLNKTLRLLPQLGAISHDQSGSSLEKSNILQQSVLEESRKEFDIYNSKENIKQINSHLSKEFLDSKSKNKNHHQYSDIELQEIKATYLTNDYLDKQFQKNNNRREIPREIKNKPSLRLHQIQTLREKSQTVLHQTMKKMVDYNTSVNSLTKNDKISRNQDILDDTMRSVNIQSAFKIYQTNYDAKQQQSRNTFNQMNFDLPIALPLQNYSSLNMSSYLYFKSFHSICVNYLFNNYLFNYQMPQIIKQKTQNIQLQQDITQRSLSQSSQKNKFTNIRLRQVSQNSKNAKMNGVVLVDRFNQRNNALAKFLRDKYML